MVKTNNKRKVNHKAKKHPKKQFGKKRAPHIKGKGGYISDGFASAGKFIGGGLGGLAGRALEKITGLGDYTNRSNTVGVGVKPGMKFGNSARQMVVAETEYLCDITSSIDWSIQRIYRINPGDPGTFPWGAGIAAKFEEYTLEGCIFYTVPESGYAVSGTDPQLGQVQIGVQSNTKMAPPNTENQLLNLEIKAANIPSQGVMCGLECKPSLTVIPHKFVRTGEIDDEDDIQLYDWANVYVAVTGCPADGNIVGKLYVTYKWKLRKKIIENGSHGNSFCGYGVRPSSVQAIPDSFTSYGSLGMTALGSGYLAFPENLASGEFLFTICWAGASAAFDPPTISFTNCELVVGPFNGVSILEGPNPAGACTSGIAAFCVRILGTDATVLFADSTGTLPGTPYTVYLTVTPFEAQAVSNSKSLAVMRKELHQRRLGILAPLQSCNSVQFRVPGSATQAFEEDASFLGVRVRSIERETDDETKDEIITYECPADTPTASRRALHRADWTRPDQAVLREHEYELMVASNSQKDLLKPKVLSNKSRTSLFG